MSNNPSTSTPSTSTSGGNATQLSTRTILLIVAFVALLLFIVQNRQQVGVNFLMLDINMPLWVLIVLSAVLGAVIERLAMWLMHRSKADKSAA